MFEIIVSYFLVSICKLAVPASQCGTGSSERVSRVAKLIMIGVLRGYCYRSDRFALEGPSQMCFLLEA